jgi:hypothetical protein
VGLGACLVVVRLPSWARVVLLSLQVVEVVISL